MAEGFAKARWQDSGAGRGGTDLMPINAAKVLENRDFVLELRSPRKCAEPAAIRGAVEFEIGALTTLSPNEKSPYLRQHASWLTEAAMTLPRRCAQTWERSGGNICLDTRVSGTTKRSLAQRMRMSALFCIKKDGDLLPR